MTLAISDTEITPLDLQKVQSGDPAEFQQLYRKFYDALVDEATHLLGDQDQAIILVQLGCIQCWIRCEEITCERYYFGYVRIRLLVYAEELSVQENRIKQELEILKEILSDQYALGGQQLASLYGELTLVQKGIIRQVLKSYYRQPGNAAAIKHQPLIRYAFYALHYILG